MKRLTAALAAAFVILVAHPAGAHEDKNAGSYSLTAGWGEEPAYAGFKNSVQLRIRGAGNRPVTDAGDALKVEITTGSQRITLPMQPNFGTGFGDPGDYRAWLIPTRPGTYTFHFTGAIRGDAVDATFTSSETTFDSVRSPADAQFPAKDPTTGDLAQRLDRVERRAVAKAEDASASARTVAIVAIVIALIGIALTLLIRARR